MQTVPVGNKILSLPAMIPSISSFETQLDPVTALQLQFQLREPVSLVSAYDLKQIGDQFIDLCAEYQKSAILFLDSGGYEHSRVRRYAGGKAPKWSISDFKTISELAKYDFAFSYDYFWRDKDNDDETADDFELRLVSEVFGSHDFIASDKLIPVLHLHAWSDGRERLSTSHIMSLVGRMASECKSPFLAIPERELGDGLLDRFTLAREICQEIDRASGGKVKLHVLGCGNPLSFAFLSVAGAVIADGLEWYRTFAADNFHLHHFQQEPVFNSASDGYNPSADWILSNELSYPIKAATRNLVSFQAFMSNLTPRVQARTVNQLVAKSFGKKAGSALRDVEA